MSEVQRLFNTKHPEGYKVFNLCSERAYSSLDVFFAAERFPFNDHNTCPLALLPKITKSMDDFLKKDPKNVIAVHCKAGKGRTGLVCSVYLLHSGVCKTATEALTKFATERTADGKGVTIPSQIRYVHYYEKIMKAPIYNGHSPSFKVIRVKMNSTPNFDLGGGCNPYFQVRHATTITNEDGTVGYKESKIYDQSKWDKKFKFYKDSAIDIDCVEGNPSPVIISGDVKFMFFDHDDLSADDKMFHFWINTTFLEEIETPVGGATHYLKLEKKDLDKAVKDKKHSKFKKDFYVEVFFELLSEDESAFERSVHKDDEGHESSEKDEDEEEKDD